MFDASGKRVVAATLESATVWSLKSGAAAAVLAPTPSPDGRAAPVVTLLARSPSGTHVASGHSDGSIRVWELASGTCAVTLSGHRSAVTALRYSPGGETLVSGGADTDIVVWDVLAESGLFRLKGHRGPVTDLAFLQPGGAAGGGEEGARGGGGGSGAAGSALLLSSSKDGLLKVGRAGGPSFL